MTADPIEYRDRWSVRSYELDANGHVNNAVYLQWAEEMANRHGEAAGYGREWCARHGGGWVVHQSEITYHRPALYGDQLDLVVRVELVRGARGVRRTEIRRGPELLCEIRSEWVWVALPSGRASRVPVELVALAAEVTRATLAGPGRDGRGARIRPPGGAPGVELMGGSMGKQKKAPAKSLKEKRAEKQAKAAEKAPAKTLSKTARNSGAGR